MQALQVLHFLTMSRLLICVISTYWPWNCWFSPKNIRLVNELKWKNKNLWCHIRQGIMRLWSGHVRKHWKQSLVNTNAVPTFVKMFFNKETLASCWNCSTNGGTKSVSRNAETSYTHPCNSLTNCSLVRDFVYVRPPVCTIRVYWMLTRSLLTQLSYMDQPTSVRFWIRQ